MFNLLSKKQLIVAVSNARVLVYPPRFLELPQNASLVIRLFSTVKSESPEIVSGQQQSPTLSYLINSCGLSPEAQSGQAVHGIQRLPHNVAILRKYGVSESNISFLTVNHPKPLMIRSDEFAKLVDRVLELGIDVSKLIFVQAIHVLYNMSQSAWEHKKEVYHRWGWSESDIRLAFSTQPKCMSLSEKNIMSTMEFLVNEINCDPKAVARCPTVLLYSLEKRIVPRCRVVKLLMVKGLIKISCNFVTLIAMTDKKFSERFVTKYQNVPQILDVDHGKLGLLDLGFNSIELANVKRL